jgi:hypothetical protein
VYSRIKKKAPRVPDITCPAIDEVITRLDDLANKQKIMTERTAKALGKKLEKLRTANELLRDSGIYWNQAVKDLLDRYVAKKKKPKF